MPRWKQSLQRDGFSLIEVVASLMLVGTLLVTVLTAHRQNARQTRTAQQRLAAIEVLERLLADPAGTALIEPNGKTSGKNPYSWRTTVSRGAAAEVLGALIVRVEVFDPNYEQGQTLAYVEMLSGGAGSSGEISAN